MIFRCLRTLLVVAPVVLFLAGCGGGGPDEPSGGGAGDTTMKPNRHTTTTTTIELDPTGHPVAPPAGDWKLNPITIQGQHMYDGVTKKPFHARGIAFPNSGEDVTEWIKTLERIKDLAPALNVIRIYEPPECAFNSSQCFTSFMRRADDLGVYVLLPGTGTLWGYLPIDVKGFNNDPQQAYESGGVLGFGQSVIKNFNFPNTLAIVVGNEFDQKHNLHRHMGVIKAYTRDLRKHLEMCNTDPESPTQGLMRRIPLMYASSDDMGDALVQPKLDYLFCDEPISAVDIFGLNMERWCSDGTGELEYANVDEYVAAAKYPGAFFYSEMGCPRSLLGSKTRSWKQVRDFFKNYRAVSGYAAYGYYGNENFNMFDGKASDAEILKDGKNFFAALADDFEDNSNSPPFEEADAVIPACPIKFRENKIVDYHNITGYETGEVGWASSCPKPYGLTSDILV